MRWPWPQRAQRREAAAAALARAGQAERKAERQAGEARRLAAELRAINADEFARALTRDLIRREAGR